MTNARARSAAVPLTSLIFGYGPMLPFLAAAAGAWTLPPPWPSIAIELAILWGSLILAFVAGVRRGFAFGSGVASEADAIRTMLLYFLSAGTALLLLRLSFPSWSLAILTCGYALAGRLDWRAAHRGNAPRHFAALRPGQFAAAVLGLAALWVRST